MRASGVRYGLALLGVFALYVAGGKLGLTLAIVHASASAVWPPTGVAIAALLVLGPRVWPAIALGAFVVNVTTTGGAAASLGLAAGNTLEGLAGAYLVRRFANGVHAFEHVTTLFRFTLFAAIVATTVSATIGVTTLVVTGGAPLERFWQIWWTWWLGDAGGALIVAPLLVLWATRTPVLRHGGDAPEALALATATAATVVVVFSPASPLATMHVPIAFVAFPVLVWAAFRFGPRAAATVVLALAIAAVGAVAQGIGPWGADDENAALLLLLGFMTTASVTTLALAAAVLEREHTSETLRATEERLRVAEEGKVAARDEFLSTAAHELRTPLTALRLAAESLVRAIDQGREIGPEKLRELAAIVDERTDRLTSLVGQLLDTVRIQSGRMDLLLTNDQDVAEIARAIVTETQARTTRHQIELRAAEPVVASVDTVRVEQVLRNLLDNAVKYSAGGRIEVDVAALDGNAVIAVRDHGPGIAPEHRARIFDRFYQARDADRDGLGLGLHLSRHIVELHGGTIDAEFPSSGGTRVVVRLPQRGTVVTAEAAG